MTLSERSADPPINVLGSSSASVSGKVFRNFWRIGSTARPRLCCPASEVHRLPQWTLLALDHLSATSSYQVLEKISPFSTEYGQSSRCGEKRRKMHRLPQACGSLPRVRHHSCSASASHRSGTVAAPVVRWHHSGFVERVMSASRWQGPCVLLSCCGMTDLEFLGV